MRFSVGIDWASAAHAVCILDQTGRVHWQGAVPHTADGLADLLARLRRFRRRGSLRVALERPSGLLVDTLLDAGLEVVPIHPNALKASRPRYSAAGAKSDPGDAFIRFTSTRSNTSLRTRSGLGTSSNRMVAG